jgi:hypothetical protein
MSAPKRISVSQFFPCVPDHMSWEDWNGNMAIYFGSQNVMFSPELEWKKAAQQMSSMAAFETFPVPSPEGFENWQDWANEFTLIINGPSY